MGHFAIPLGVDETPDEKATHVQMGGPGARFVGNRGGLDLDTEVYDCQYLWAIQITEDPEARFVRLDQNGDEFDFAMELSELLPFDLTDEALPDPDLELLEDLDDDEDDEPSNDSNDAPPLFTESSSIMDILALIITGLFICFILWVTTASLGFPLGTLVGVAAVAIIAGGYFLFFLLYFH